MKTKPTVSAELSLAGWNLLLKSMPTLLTKDWCIAIACFVASILLFSSLGMRSKTESEARQEDDSIASDGVISAINCDNFNGLWHIQDDNYEWQIWYSKCDMRNMRQWIWHDKWYRYNNKCDTINTIWQVGCKNMYNKCNTKNIL